MNSSSISVRPFAAIKGASKSVMSCHRLFDLLVGLLIVKPVFKYI